MGPKVVENYRDIGVDVGHIVRRILSHLSPDILAGLHEVRLLEKHDHAFACYKKREGAIEIYVAGSGNLHGHPTFGGQATLIYNLIPGSQDNWILLDASMSTGSGTADMYAYIPNALFDLPGDFVYLYSHFGTHVPNSGGFEEWGVEKFQDSPPLVPVPAAAILGMFGLSVAGWRLRRYA